LSIGRFRRRAGVVGDVEIELLNAAVRRRGGEGSFTDVQAWLEI
jgi:hypothetical protein